MSCLSMKEALEEHVVWLETRPMFAETCNDEGEPHAEHIIGTLMLVEIWKRMDFFIGECIVVRKIKDVWKQTIFLPSEYMRNWRCWKYEPTKKEMDATAWEDSK